MNTLLFLLFTGKLKVKKVNTRKLSKTIRKDSSVLLTLCVEIIEAICDLIKFISRNIKSITNKKICQSKVVESKKNKKVIDLNEYKLKKAK